MHPVIREGDAEVFELAGGRALLVDVATGKKTEFRNAEECWREIHRRRQARAGR